MKDRIYLDASSVLNGTEDVAGLEMLSRKVAVEKYGSGLFSLSQAAEFAGVSVGEMIEVLAEKGIRANYSLRGAEESYGNVGMLGKKPKKGSQ
jgi:predicted HTH domain antitoxin